MPAIKAKPETQEVKELTAKVIASVKSDTKSISEDDLLQMCLAMKHRVTFAGLITETEPDIVKPKTSGMAGRIKKRSHTSVCINFIYANSVNNQREREGKEADFEPEPRKWGQRIKGTPVVIHKGQYYLETKVERSISTAYYLDGKEVQKADIAQYLREKDGESSRQELDKEVVLRDYKLSNIMEIRINGEVLTVKH